MGLCRFSVMHHMLALKRDNPLPRAPLLPKDITLGLDREQSCPKLKNIDDFIEEKPQWGMPYGLPALADEDYLALQQWLEDGALMAKPPAQRPSARKRPRQIQAHHRSHAIRFCPTLRFAGCPFRQSAGTCLRRSGLP